MSDSSGHGDNYNRGGLNAFLFSMAFVFLFFVYVVAIHPGVDLKENIQDPKDLEAAPVDTFDISKVSEPWVGSEELVKYGAKVYAQNCAVCHGAEGRGDGAGGASLNPKPRNLVDGPWKLGGGLIAHYKVLQEGIPGGGMVSFAHIKSADRWAMVHFIESITNVKGNDDPAKVAEFAKNAK